MKILSKIKWFFILTFNKKFVHNMLKLRYPINKGLSIYYKGQIDKCKGFKRLKSKLSYRKYNKKVKKFERLEKKRRKKIDRYFQKVHLEIFFGVPGSGKTTFAAYLSKKAIKLGIPVFSNVPIKGTYRIDPKEDLGKYLIERCLVIIDEAGLEHNNRKFKEFNDENRYFYKFHRHYQCKVAVFSQADDMDLTIRNVAYRLHLVKKSMLPYFIKIRPMIKTIDIDETTHQPMAMYKWDWFIFTKRIFSPMVWKLFDTYEGKLLPSKKFEKW